jgi:AraC family transcriptional regulator
MHMAEPRIEALPEKKLAGKRMTMSFANNKTREVWQAFMPRRTEISNAIGSELYSVEVYTQGFFDRFDPTKEFEKWAAVEVSDPGSTPSELEIITIPQGLYAVFTHRGPATEGPKTYGYIFQEWLPKSGFVLEPRPHFALMGEKYKHDDPESEEEIWIPVSARSVTAPESTP